MEHRLLRMAEAPLERNIPDELSGPETSPQQTRKQAYVRLEETGKKLYAAQEKVDAATQQKEKTEAALKLEGYRKQVTGQIVVGTGEFARIQSVEQGVDSLMRSAEGVVILSDIAAQNTGGTIRARVFQSLAAAARRGLANQEFGLTQGSFSAEQVATIRRNIETYVKRFPGDRDVAADAQDMTRQLERIEQQIKKQDSREAVATPDSLARQQETKKQEEAAKIDRDFAEFNDGLAKGEQALDKAQRAYESNGSNANYQSLLSAIDALAAAYGGAGPLLEAMPQDTAKRYRQEFSTVTNGLQEARAALLKTREDQEKAGKSRRESADKAFKSLSAATANRDLAAADRAIASLRSLAQEWTGQDGAAPEQFLRGLAAAEAMAASMRAHEDAHRTVDDVYREVLDTVQKRFAAANAGLEKRVKDLNAVNGFPQLGNLGSMLTGVVEGVSGANQANEKTVESDVQYREAIASALRQLNSVSLSSGRNLRPEARLQQIMALLPRTTRVNFDQANELLGRARKNLQATESIIRDYGQHIPGGSLGVAIAGFSPADPDSGTALATTLASTMIDSIPAAPGTGAVRSVIGRYIFRRFNARQAGEPQQEQLSANN